jgi:hypothetical protein
VRRGVSCSAPAPHQRRGAKGLRSPRLMGVVEDRATARLRSSSPPLLGASLSGGWGGASLAWVSSVALAPRSAEAFSAAQLGTSSLPSRELMTCPRGSARPLDLTHTRLKASTAHYSQPTLFPRHYFPTTLVVSLIWPHAAPRRYRNREHLRYVAQQACLIWGRKQSDPHHLRYLQPRALGRKVSDEFAVPLCRSHHRAVHRAGDEQTWWKAAGIDPVKIARQLWQQTRLDDSQDPHEAGLAAPPKARSIASASDGMKVSRSDQVVVCRPDDGRTP